MRALMFVVGISLISVGISPQGTQQELRAKSFLDLGMSTLQGGEKEGACLLLDKARKAAALIEDAARRGELVAKIDFQATLADPLLPDRRKAASIAARALLRAGRVYLKKGWIATASPFITEAAQLAPKLAADDLKSLSDAMPGARVGTGDQIFAVFGHMENAYNQADWVKTKVGLEAPVDKIDGPSMILSKSVVLPGTKVHFEALAREAECRLGLAIGFNKDSAFHLIELFRYDGKTDVRCHSYNRAFKTLGSAPLDCPKSEWEKWIPFDVEIREKELTWRIGKSKTYITRCTKPGLSGKLGFYIVYGDNNNKDFMFRNFSMEDL